jgi:hypothetical protein
VFCQPIGIATELAVAPKAQRYNTLELSCPVWRQLIGKRLVLGLTKELGVWVMSYRYKNKLKRVVQFLVYTLHTKVDIVYVYFKAIHFAAYLCKIDTNIPEIKIGLVTFI